MRVLVTRPQAQAEAWVVSLREHGIDAVALPLIDIAAPADPAAVQAAWQTLTLRALVVFVSPNAAGQFFVSQPSGSGWPAGVDAAAVGPGTSAVLRAHGVPAAAIVEPPVDAARFDSEALWSRLSARDWRGRGVLVVRGDGGREWLADTLRSQGATVDFVSAYRRVAPRLDGERRRHLDAALARPGEHLWFFSSGEAVEQLGRACPQARWDDARALATHPRIAERARDCGFHVIYETRPPLGDVIACIKSIAS